MSVVATVSFPNMSVSVDRLDALGGELPSTAFNVERSIDSNERVYYDCYYKAADETFKGKSVQAVINQIVKFLSQDTVIKNLGRPKVKRYSGPKKE